MEAIPTPLQIESLQMESIDVEIIRSIRPLDSCCQSYLTARGRCFTCPGMAYGKSGDDDDDDDGDDDFEEEE